MKALDYPFTTLLRRVWGGHRGWRPVWRSSAPKEFYDFVIIGGGGHGLAAAYYLAKKYGACFECGFWLSLRRVRVLC
jgi:hypothetical protein